MTDRMKRGDLLPQWEVTLYDGDPGDPDTVGFPFSPAVELSTATRIRVIGKHQRSDVVFIDVDTSIPGSDSGVVQMDWPANSTDECGVIEWEIKVTWPGGKVQSFPVQGFLRTTIYDAAKVGA